MRSSAAAFAALGIVAAARVASAVSVTWAFDGTLEVIQGTPASDALQGLGVVIGAPVHGLLTWDSSTPDLNSPSDQVALYGGAIDEVEITIGGWALGKISGTSTAEWVVSSVGGEFTYVNLFDPTGTYSGSSVLSLELQARDPTLFAGHPMPVGPPSLADLLPFGADPTSMFGFGSDLELIASGGPGAVSTFRAELTSLQRVPEPQPALALAALVLLPLALRHR